MITDLVSYMRKFNDIKRIEEEYGIKTYSHPTLPLVGFKYNMIDSPKYDPIVRWARGSVLERNTWNIVAQPFRRFYNYGECEADKERFDWSNFTVTSKEDGSLCILYFYNGSWLLNTSGSFGEGKAGLYHGTWAELFDHSCFENQLSLHLLTDKLNPNYTYLFELCSIYNKIVTTYPKPTIFFLGAYDIKNGYELSYGEILEEARRLDLGRFLPKIYDMKSIDEVLEFLHEKESSDPTFEGVVIRDRQNIRFKVKNEAYLRLHHMFDNGNVANPKYFVPFLVKGEKEEIITYFPELKPLLDKEDEKIQKEWKNLLETWKECYRIEVQKDFALAISKRTKFTGLLFTLRKSKGLDQTQEDLRALWNESHEIIVKYLFKE